MRPQMRMRNLDLPQLENNVVQLLSRPSYPLIRLKME